MRADTIAEEIASARSRLNLPTPCPECADPYRDTHCDRCINTIAAYVDMKPEELRKLIGRKNVPIQ